MRLPTTPNKSTLQQWKFSQSYVTWVGTIRRCSGYTVKKTEQFQAWPAKLKYQEQASR